MASPFLRSGRMHSPTADLVVYGGRVLSQDPNRPTAEALAIAGDRIVAVGKAADLRPCISRRTQLLDCHGHTVLPGFIDPHLHLFSWASRLCGADLSGLGSIAEIQRSLADRLPRLEPGEWLRGYGYDEFFLAEKRHPTRHDLDAVCRDRPIVVRHRSGHAAVLNSAGLRRAGIGPSFTDPYGGHAERDPSGQPTGVVYELEPFLRTVIPRLPAADFRAGIKRAGQDLLRLGVTSFHDASASNTLEDVSVFQQLSADGLLNSRATVMLGTGALEQLLEARLEPFSGDDRVRLGSIKIMLHESRGALHPEPSALRPMVWRAHQHGFQLAFHAVEEAAIGLALDALAQAQRRLFRPDHRHRIEHCSLCPAPFLEQLKTLGCAVVSQPGFVHWYGEKYTAEVAPDLHSWLYRMRSLIDRHIPVAGSSDCPIAPLAPLTSIAAALTRQSQTGLGVNAAERVSLAQALGLFTSAAAWVGFEENKKGKIVPGMLADLVILDGDIAAVPEHAIASLSVTTTIIGGKVVWSRT